MSKNVFTILTAVFISSVTIAQVDSVYTGERTDSKKAERKKGQSEKFENFKSKLVYGGFVMPGFYSSGYGTVFYINASPNVGYRVTEKLIAGIGFNYNYSSVTLNNGSKYSQSIYGPTLYARYRVLDNVFAQLQYDKLNQPNYYSSKMDRVWVDYVMAGGGYYQRIGDHAAMVFSALFNLTPNKNSVYSNPLIQIGFVGGF